jgi:pyruvate ferredoxin oxidoreductase beta subunit
MSARTTILTVPEEELVHPGHRACSGCGLSILYRFGLKALGRDTILIVPPSCLTVLQGLYPIAATQLPCLNVTFASTAAAATGIISAMKAQGKEGVTVAAWAGDGGTSDIGIQALSGACERGDNFIFICYMPAIMAAHHLAYVATGSAAYPLDVYDKITKAKGITGPKYIHLHTPCPPGWGYDTRYTVKVGRLAVETGLFDLYEIEHGVFRLTGASRKLVGKERKPVAAYFEAQTRFRALSKTRLTQIQQEVDAKWAGYEMEKRETHT